MIINKVHDDMTNSQKWVYSGENDVIEISRKDVMIGMISGNKYNELHEPIIINGVY